MFTRTFQDNMTFNPRGHPAWEAPLLILRSKKMVHFFLQIFNKGRASFIAGYKAAAENRQSAFRQVKAEFLGALRPRANS